jgi:AcrR family transcriptional regulator
MLARNERGQPQWDRYATVTESSTISGRAPRDERRPDVERRLIEAVTRICADGGSFAELSISRLVREAGLARATFYLYFEDRSAFVLRLADHVRDQLARPVSVLWGAALEDRATLDGAIRDLVSTFRDEYAVIAAVVETAASDPAVGKRLESNMEMFITESAYVLEAAQGRRAIRSDVPSYETAAALIWMVERTCYQLAREKDPDRQARLSDALAAIAWHALHE